MAKKKKSKKQKGLQKQPKSSKTTEKISSKTTEKVEVELPQLDLDAALRSSKKTESALLDLLGSGSDVKIKEEAEALNNEEYYTPQLSYESKSEKIVENYLMEDVPLTKQPHIPSKERTKLVTQTPQETGEQLQETVEEQQIPTELTIEKEIPAPPSPNEDIYIKLTDFFEKIYKGYLEKYDVWEQTVSNLLAILRKMRKITKKNTEDLEASINNLYKKIQLNLEQFKLKRDHVETVAGINIETMSSEFKRVLGLLELQIKEYQLKKITDDYIHEQRLLL